MSTYTNDENIRFLHDKNISQTLGDDTARQTNTVPSLDLLNEVNNALTAYDSNLCAYLDNLNEQYEYDMASPYLSVITKIEQVKGQLTGIESIELLSSHVRNLKEFVEDTIDSLDVATLAETNKFVRTLEEVDGKIQATFSKVLSSDLDGQLKQTQVENLTADLDSCYKKAGGLIDGNAQVNGQLSVSGESIVNDDSTVRGNFIQGRGTSYTGDAEHSVVMGISASTNKDDVFLWNGKQNEAYTDHGRGTFNINAVSGVNGVFVGSQSLEKIVDDKREAARVQAKDYTDSVSATLSTDYVRKIANAKTEAINTAVNELAVPYVNGISTALSTDYVNKIATAKAQAIETAGTNATNYTNSVSSTLSTDYVTKIQQAATAAINVAATDATSKVNALDTNLSNVGTLVSADLAFDYEESTRMLKLNIKDYAGHNHTFTIDSARFIKGRIVDHVNIVEIDGQQVLRIWWTVEEGGTGVYSDVPLATLAQVYRQGEGITITLGEDGYVIAVNDTIVNKTFLNGKIAEINADIAGVNDKANTNTVKINSLAAISADHDGRIQTLESGLTTANSNIQTNADSIADANNHIASLETYATALSSPGGQIQTLSNAITANYDYAHDKLSSRIALDEGKINDVSAHAERLQTYANSLSDANGQIQTLSNAITANTADIALNQGNIASLQNYASSLSSPGGQIQTLSNAITANYDYAHDKISTRLSADEIKISDISAHAERLQTYANALSNDGGTINTLSNDIIQLSTSIIDSDSFIGEIKVNYNNLTAGTAQAWVSQNGNTLSGVIKHFTLAPLGYVKENTVIKVTYTNVPSNADRTTLANLKYTTDDGVTFTDNDYIIIHGDFERAQLEDIKLSNVYYINAVKRNELFELSNTVYDNYIWLSGGNSTANTHAISGNNDFLGENRFPQSTTKFNATSALNAIVVNDFIVSNKLSVTNDSMLVTKPTAFNSVISAKSNITCDLNVLAKGNLSVTENISCGSDIVVSGNILAKGKLSANATALSVATPTNLLSTLTVNGAASFSQNMSVDFSKAINSVGGKSLSAELSTRYLKTETSSSSQLSTKFDSLSSKYVSRLSTDNSLMQEGGCFTNYLASSFNENGGGLRVFSSKNADNTPNTTKMYTSYQLSCIRQHTNSTTFTTYAFNDSDNNGIVRKSTGASMLSAAMFTALKSTLLNAVYPVNSIYVDYTGSATTCPLTAFGGTWTKPAGNPTVNITVNGTQVDAPIWQRTA